MNFATAPTHNLTLTRTALELLDTDGKLRDGLPGMKLPKFPIDASSLPSPPPKRKSAFLNTLSRLASPSSKSASTRASRRLSSSGAHTNGNPSAAASPITSPSQEIGDPFDSINVNGTVEQYTASNSTVTGLAAYLTTLANDPQVRQTKVWRRFVRVRTDDLQSTRAERAIKRVRSDLAAHSSHGHSEGPLSMSQVLGEAESLAASRQTSASGSINDTTEAVEDQTVEGAGSEVNGKAEEKTVSNGHAVDGSDQSPQTPNAGESSSGVDAPVDASGEIHAEATTPVPESAEHEEGRSTPVPESTSRRLMRSQSAEPTNRGTRTYSSTVSSTLRGKPSQASMTGDDSSISTTGRRSTRKKRSKSTDPHASGIGRKSQRKVVVDDFEMMRVLGKGCAGKVLLVRHKPTQDVFALKAITKRHVLAHQELQHTLTEQAVLKRMAAEGTDPFVVKLWWSFHDKENLFLVMVRTPVVPLY